MESTIQSFAKSSLGAFEVKASKSWACADRNENVKDKYNYTCQPETLVYFVTYKDCCLLN